MWQQPYYVNEKLRAFEAERQRRRPPVVEERVTRPAGPVLRAAGRTLSRLGERLEAWGGAPG